MKLKSFAAVYSGLIFAGLFLASRLWPDEFAQGFPALVNPGQFLRTFDYRGIIAGLGGLGLVLLLEWKIVGWEKCGIKKVLTASASTNRDVLTCLAYVFGIWNFIGYGATLGASFYLGKFIAKDHSFQILSAIPGDFLKALATIFVAGFFEYWAHRWFHTFRPLWALHKYHHTAKEMTVFSADRNNPFSGPLMAVITTIPYSYLGGTLGSFAWIGAIRIILDYVIHSEITSSWGWVGRWLLASPNAHRVHHSANPKHFNSNFGFFLIFWDRVFGTYNSDTNVSEFGAPDGVFNQAPLGEEMAESLYRVFKPNRAD